VSFLPGWNSVEGASWWHDAFWWLGIVCLVLLAASEIIAKSYTDRKDVLIAEAQQKREASRHLDATQKQRLAEFLADKPKASLIIKADAAAKDGRAFADEIAAFLRGSCGWSVGVDSAIITGADTTGLWLTIKDRDHVPASIATILGAFEYAHMPVHHEVSVDPGVPTANEIWLAVGLKP
jgi:hypothetical protein